MERNIWLSLTKEEKRIYLRTRTDYAERIYRNN